MSFRAPARNLRENIKSALDNSSIKSTKGKR